VLQCVAACYTVLPCENTPVSERLHDIVRRMCVSVPVSSVTHADIRDHDEDVCVYA